MASAISANRLELLQIADAVARDKSIDKQVVLTAMEEAEAAVTRHFREVFGFRSISQTESLQ